MGLMIWPIPYGRCDVGYIIWTMLYSQYHIWHIIWSLLYFPLMILGVIFSWQKFDANWSRSFSSNFGWSRKSDTVRRLLSLILLRPLPLPMGVLRMTNYVKFNYSCSMMIPQFEACTKLKLQTRKVFSRQKFSTNESILWNDVRSIENPLSISWNQDQMIWTIHNHTYDT